MWRKVHLSVDSNDKRLVDSRPTSRLRGKRFRESHIKVFVPSGECIGHIRCFSLASNCNYPQTIDQILVSIKQSRSSKAQRSEEIRP